MDLASASAGSTSRARELGRLVANNPQQLGGLANIDLLDKGGVEAARRWLSETGRQGPAIREARALVNRYAVLRTSELPKEEALLQEIQQAEADLLRTKAELKLVPEAAAKQAAFERLSYDQLKDEKTIICFPSGTLVKTPSGDRPIETLRPNDPIISFDEANTMVRAASVAAELHNWTRHLVEVELDGDMVRATRHHYFYVHGEERWLQARQLYPALSLRGIDGNPRPIRAVRTVGASVATHNLSVADCHTFFVGKHGVLVHNDDLELVSNFASTERVQSWIYAIRDKTTQQVVYVGKTNQAGGIEARFQQHLEKRGWTRAQYQVEEIPGESGVWTEFETAVHEQRQMMRFGGPKSINSKTPLLNEVSAITEDKFNEFRKPQYGQNPCR
jgi:hypothetical protein